MIMAINIIMIMIDNGKKRGGALAAWLDVEMLERAIICNFAKIDYF